MCGIKVYIFSLSFLFSNAIMAKMDSASAQKESDKAFSSIMGEYKSKVFGEIEKSNSQYPTLKRSGPTGPKVVQDKENEWKAWNQKFKTWKKSGEKRGLPAPEFTGVVKSVMENPCSDALRDIVKSNSKISEVFITDHVGANVCAAEPTSDFDQGDEDKWEKPFNGSDNPHVGNAKRDKSSKKMQMQISYPILKDGKKIGVATIGVSE